jgi:hypothetical protein
MEAGVRRFEQPDSSKEFPNGNERVVEVGGVHVGYATFQPGWRWSNDVKPIVGSESCRRLHMGYILSGQLHVEMDDGTTLDAGPGNLFVIPPGHDGWVVGDEPCRMIDWADTAQRYLDPVTEAEVPA